MAGVADGTEPENAPKLRFIRDVAADVDFFGSHARVAKAIAGVIAGNDDLKVIGLLGRWGSGKSTVVRHVEKALNAPDGGTGVKTHVFCYDAWLHQSDPPRRAFLETLVAFLVKNELPTKDEWRLELDILNRQIEDTTTTSTPILTPMGIVLLLSLALIPLGMHYIGHDWYDAAYAPTASLFEKIAYKLGWLMLAIPPLIATCIAVRRRPDSASILALFVNRQVQTQTNRVVRSPDPTTIEFQKFFRQVIAEIGDQHRLIFVIDNLDRLHENEAVQMWSTIRSFFLGSELADRTTRGPGLPTVLLPIDQDAVERMYAKEHGVLGKALARSFMDKTFDLTFHVTRPVLSDWNLYIAAQLEAVFGDLFDEAWAYQVGRLYESHTRGGHEVTPRALNVTINDIATLWLQWRDEIPFVTIAYYVIFREAIDAKIYEAVSAPIVPIADLDPDWQRGLAALYFGAPRDKAIQVLIEPRLRAAIDGWGKDEFAELATLPGFPETLQRILDTARPANPRFVSKVSYLLSELALEPEIWTRAAQSALRELYGSGQPYEILDDWDVAALRGMIELCPEPLAIAFIKEAAARLSQPLDNMFEANGEARKAYVALIGTVVKAARARDIANLTIRYIGEAESYLATLATAVGDPDSVRTLAFAGQDQKLVEVLVAQLNGSTPAGVDARFRALFLRNPLLNWDPLIEESRKHLAEKPAASAGTFSASGVLGRLWRTSEKAKKAVAGLSADGLLNARVSESQDPARHARLTRLTALIILSEAGLDNPGNSWENLIKASPTMPDLVREALDQFEPTGYARHLVTVAKSSPHALPLCKPILTKKVATGAVGNLAIADVLDRFSDYLKCIDDAHHGRFVSQLTNYEAFWGAIGQRPFDDVTRHILRSLALSGLAPAKAQATARTALKNRLQQVSQATWTSAIQSGSEPFAAARALAAVQSRALNVGQGLFDALSGMMPALVQDVTPDWAVRWFQGAALLSPAMRKAAHLNLVDRLLSGTAAAGTSTLLSLADDIFFTDANLVGNGDRVVRHLISPLIASSSGLSWLRQHEARILPAIEAASKDSRAFLKEQTKSTLRSLDTHQRKNLRALAKKWQI